MGANFIILILIKGISLKNKNKLRLFSFKAYLVLQKQTTKATISITGIANNNKTLAYFLNNRPRIYYKEAQLSGQISRLGI